MSEFNMVIGEETLMMPIIPKDATPFEQWKAWHTGDFAAFYIWWRDQQRKLLDIMAVES